jgi:hypothetical protein
VTTDPDALFREYENGVADVLSFITEGQAVVTRNTHRVGRDSGVPRQIDVLVEGNALGLTTARVVVDAKRWNHAIDVGDMAAFIGLVEDVGADFGFIVTTEGATPAAHQLANSARGIRVRAVSVSELEQWRPKGTVFQSLRVPDDALILVGRTLRNAGFRVARDDYGGSPTQTKIEVFRHYGTTTPSGEIQREHTDRVSEVLDNAGVVAERVANGVVMGGGTPAYRYLPILLRGTPIGFHVLASTEAEVDESLQALSELSEDDRSDFTVDIPSDWPTEASFLADPPVGS